MKKNLKKMQQAAFNFAIVLAGSSADVFDDILSLKEMKEILGPKAEFFGPYFKNSECGFVVVEHSSAHPDEAIAYPCGPSVTSDTPYASLKVGVLRDEKTKADAFIFFAAKAREAWVI